MEYHNITTTIPLLSHNVQPNFLYFLLLTIITNAVILKCKSVCSNTYYANLYSAPSRGLLRGFPKECSQMKSVYKRWLELRTWVHRFHDKMAWTKRYTDKMVWIKS